MLTIPHPNFFIVGAAKSGTTSLWMYLKQHPEVYMPDNPKEPAFFCHLYGYDNFAAYLELFAKAKGKKAIGESSHAYLSSPESATWIKNVFPQARIIMILRNPVERAFSLYNWMISHGYEWINTFEKALLIEKKRLTDNDFKYNNPEYYYNFLYFKSGLYSEQIERYLTNFNREKILFLLFDDLVNSPIETIQDIYRFLKIDPTFTPEIKVYNQGGIKPAFVLLQFLLKQNLSSNIINSPLGFNFQKTMMKTNLKIGQWLYPNYNFINLETYERLHIAYSKDIQKVSKLLDRDLSSWLK